MMRSIKNCNVCVVGGAGFLGSHLVDHLIEDRNCKTLVIDNLSSGRREFVHKQAIFEHADITGSEHFLRGMFKQYEIEYVVNAAAMPYIPVSFERPVYVAELNYIGALRVINAAQEAGCKGILQVSSAEIFGEGKAFQDWDPQYERKYEQQETQESGGEQYTYDTAKIDEEAPVHPHSTYGASKAAIDMTIQARWKEAKTPCIVVRQFNSLGERETHPYVVTTIISQLSGFWEQVKDESHSSWRSMGTPTIQLGNNSFRDFMYAGDVVKVWIELLERGQFGEVYNLGSENGIKIYDLAKKIGQLMGFSEVKVEQDPARVRPWEIWHLQSDNTKLVYTLIPEAQLGDFREAVARSDSVLAKLTPLDEALRRTINYYNESGRKWCWE